MTCSKLKKKLKFFSQTKFVIGHLPTRCDSLARIIEYAYNKTIKNKNTEKIKFPTTLEWPHWTRVRNLAMQGRSRDLDPPTWHLNVSRWWTRRKRSLGKQNNNFIKQTKTKQEKNLGNPFSDIFDNNFPGIFEGFTVMLWRGSVVGTMGRSLNHEGDNGGVLGFG